MDFTAAHSTQKCCFKRSLLYSQKTTVGHKNRYFKSPKKQRALTVTEALEQQTLHCISLDKFAAYLCRIFLLNQIEYTPSPSLITKDDVVLVTLYSKRTISGLL